MMTLTTQEEKLLYKAFDLYSRESFDTYDFKKDSALSFSTAFEEKMQKLIKRHKKPYYRLINTVAKRVACIIAALIIAAAGTVLSVDALREGVKNFFVEVYERFLSITFEKTDNESMTIEKYYEPSFLPVGFEVFETESTNVSYKLKYRDENGNEIHYRQSIISDGFNVDTENGIPEEIGNGLYIEQKEYNLKMYFWSNSEYKFSLHVYGYVTKEELLKIADSINAED